MYSITKAAQKLYCSKFTLYGYLSKNNVPTIKDPQHNIKCITEDIFEQIQHDLNYMPKNSMTIEQYAQNHHLKPTTVKNYFEKLKIQPINWQPKLLMHKRRNRFYSKQSIQKVNEYRKAINQKNTVLDLKPNTTIEYNPKTDFKIYDLEKKLHISYRTILQWLQYQTIPFSVDQYYKIHFKPNQFEFIQDQFKNYPNDIVINNKELAQYLNTTTQRLSQIKKKHQIKHIKVLGDPKIYYNQHQINQLKDYLN